MEWGTPILLLVLSKVLFRVLPGGDSPVTGPVQKSCLRFCWNEGVSQSCRWSCPRGKEGRAYPNQDRATSSQDWGRPLPRQDWDTPPVNTGILSPPPHRRTRTFVRYEQYPSCAHAGGLSCSLLMINVCYQCLISNSLNVRCSHNKLVSFELRKMAFALTKIVLIIQIKGGLTKKLINLSIQVFHINLYILPYLPYFLHIVA